MHSLFGHYLVDNCDVKSTIQNFTSLGDVYFKVRVLEA